MDKTIDIALKEQYEAWYLMQVQGVVMTRKAQDITQQYMADRTGKSLRAVQLFESLKVESHQTLWMYQQIFNKNFDI